MSIFNIRTSIPSYEDNIWGKQEMANPNDFYNFNDEVVGNFPMEEIDEDYSEARGRRKSCKAKGLTGKALRACIRQLRAQDKKKSAQQKRSEAKKRRQDWKKNKKSVRQDLKKDGKAFYQRAFKTGAKVNPVLVDARLSFKALLRINMFGLSTKLDKAKKNPIVWTRVKKKWENLGGNISNLEKNVNIGRKKKPVFSKYRKGWTKPTNFSGFDDYSNFGAESAVALGKVLASASIIIATLLPLLKGIGGRNIDDETYNALADEALNSAEYGDMSEWEKDALYDEIERAESEFLDEDYLGLGISKTTFWIIAGGIIVIGGGLAMYFILKKK